MTDDRLKLQTVNRSRVNDGGRELMAKLKECGGSLVKDGETVRVVLPGVPVVQHRSAENDIRPLVFVLGEWHSDMSALSELEKILEGCDTLDEANAFQKELYGAVQEMEFSPRLLASHAIKKLTGMVAEKKKTLGAKMGGELLDDTMKPPAKKEKKGKIRR